MTDGWLGFFGGLLAALVGGLIASLLQRAHEHQKERSAAMLATYLMLLELNQLYFWVASSEINDKDPPEEILKKCRETSWRIADKLRSFDDVEYLDEILTILFSSSIQTANERASRLEKLLDKYGKLVNPMFSDSMSRISKDNLIGQMQRGSLKTNAPGAWRYER